MDGTDGGDPLYYNSPNDVVVDKKGNVWFTDPAYAYYQGLVPNKAARSCFDGEWTEKSRVFDNSYFTDLLTKTYAPETVAVTGCPQHRSRAGTIMLVSDLALLEDPAFKAVVEEYAANQSLFFAEYASAWIKLQENGVAEQLRDEL